MTSTLVCHYFVTFVFVFLPRATLSIAKSYNDGSFFNPETPKKEAERLIRSFNLFPKHDMNIHVGEVPEYKFDKESRIVEKKFKFPSVLQTEEPVPDLGHHAGYYKIQHSKDARMFYFFFESRNSSKDPVVIWMTGGPGCSSELALFYENGPFHITSNLSLTWNDFGWDKVSNIIYVDQPIGTGFSYSSDDSDTRHSEEGVANDLYEFLQEFFKGHPQFAGNDFYITGESYAGHYIPALAYRINQGNKNKEGITINLKGMAIGNGFTNPEIQYQAYTDFALDNKLLTQDEYNMLKPAVLQCVEESKLCGPDGGIKCEVAYGDCNRLFNQILEKNMGINVYDIRKMCESGPLCYDYSNMERFLNLKSVKTALGVGDIEFVSCSSKVYEAMLQDWMRNLEVGIPALLEDGIKLLVYAGEYDLICNWLGNSKWLDAMTWSGQKKYLGAPMIPFSVDGVEAGLQKGYGPLTFLKVHNAGHKVPMDQPKNSLEMLTRWMLGKSPGGRQVL
ncbi:serine carboxypeptidase-like [Dorcoceras hygrometricum]|uniref:Carboxypeptidase n=1 Tax=Dorcoceras hygrometricum TaxID=472368 RepID=A0A2Z7CKB9_9LAMI|nr:serine carboxypeptidase-like [Dorcoceras hygrometricum]